MMVNGIIFKESYDENEYTKLDCYQKNTVILVDRHKRTKLGSQMVAVSLGDIWPVEKDVEVYDVRFGKRAVISCKDILGAIKKECLSDLDRMDLSAFKPFESDLPDIKDGLRFSAYSYLQNERYRGPVFIHTKEELREYVFLQKEYQYIIRICDIDDYIVMEIENGEVVFPPKECAEEDKEISKESGEE